MRSVVREAMVYIAVNASFPFVLCIAAGVYDLSVVDRDSNFLLGAARIGVPPLLLWSVFVLARFTRYREEDAVYRRTQAIVAGWLAAGLAALVWAIVSMVASEVSTSKFHLEILGAILAIPAAVLCGLASTVASLVAYRLLRRSRAMHDEQSRAMQDYLARVERSSAQAPLTGGKMANAEQPPLDE